MHRTTLEQWAILDSVVTTGSFSRAADALHRSQSSVSYNLAQLQTQLGVTLLIPEGRRTVLTPAGATLLRQVRPLLKTFGYIEARAATLQDGMRSQLHLVVDAICPREHLFTAPPLHIILRQDLAPPDEPVSFLLSALKTAK